MVAKMSNVFRLLTGLGSGLDEGGSGCEEGKDGENLLDHLDVIVLLTRLCI